jgi:hypothetical protein
MLCVECAVSGDLSAAIAVEQSAANVPLAVGGGHSRPRPARPEDMTQRSIVEALERAGYRVMQTSRRRRGVMVGGKWRYSGRGDGVSAGLGDLLVRYPSWPRLLWAMLEVKAPGGTASMEQVRLAQDQALAVVDNPADALRAIESLAREYAFRGSGAL